MLIFGRSPNLTLALLAAIFNLLVTFHIGGFDPTAEQIAQVNTFLFALVAFIANSDTLVRAAGDAAHARLRQQVPTAGTRADDPPDA